MRPHLYFELLASLVSFYHSWNTTAKNTRLWLPLLFASDVQKRSGFAVGFQSLCSLTSISPGLLLPAFKPAEFCLSGDSAWQRIWLPIFTTRKVVPLLSASAAETPCATLFMIPRLVKAALSSTMLAWHKLIPVYPKASRKRPAKQHDSFHKHIIWKM